MTVLCQQCFAYISKLPSPSPEDVCELQFVSVLDRAVRAIMVTIQNNVAYMSVRALVWTAVAAGNFVWLGSKANVASSKPRALPYMIAGTIALFAANDLWILIAITSQRLYAFYVEELTFSIAWGAMLVRF